MALLNDYVDWLELIEVVIYNIWRAASWERLTYDYPAHPILKAAIASPFLVTP